MTYKGIVRGNTIELEEHFPFPEGEHVEVEISASIPPRKGSPQAILKLAGTLTDAEADFIRQACIGCAAHRRQVLAGAEQMRYLVDTNGWTYIQQKRPAIVARVQNLPSDAILLMSVVNQAELLGGIMFVADEQRRQKLTNLYEQVIAMTADILPVTSEVAMRFAEVYAGLRLKGRPIGTNDMWIAATALAHGLILVTSDAHFQHIEGLTTEDWMQII